MKIAIGSDKSGFAAKEAVKAYLVEASVEAIEAKVMEHMPAVCEAFFAQNPPLEPTYAMRSRRTDKGFPMTCADLEMHFAELLLPKYPALKIDLKHANLVVEVDIRSRHAFISFERVAGPGGLPAGSGGRNRSRPGCTAHPAGAQD